MSQDHDNRKHPGAGFWATIILAAVVIYPVSIGPVAWLDVKLGHPTWLETVGTIFYAPLAFAVNNSPDELRNRFGNYIEWCAGRASP